MYYTLQCYAYYRQGDRYYHKKCEFEYKIVTWTLHLIAQLSLTAAAAKSSQAEAEMALTSHVCHLSIVCLFVVNKTALFQPILQKKKCQIGQYNSRS